MYFTGLFGGKGGGGKGGGGKGGRGYRYRSGRHGGLVQVYQPVQVAYQSQYGHRPVHVVAPPAIAPPLAVPVGHAHSQGAGIAIQQPAQVLAVQQQQPLTIVAPPAPAAAIVAQPGGISGGQGHSGFGVPAQSLAISGGPAVTIAAAPAPPPVAAQPLILSGGQQQVFGQGGAALSAQPLNGQSQTFVQAPLQQTQSLNVLPQQSSLSQPMLVQTSPQFVSSAPAFSQSLGSPKLVSDTVSQSLSEVREVDQSYTHLDTPSSYVGDLDPRSPGTVSSSQSFPAVDTLVQNALTSAVTQPKYLYGPPA